MVKGQTPFGTPPTDSDLIDSPSGFATLESFQRDIDRDRIAAIARSHAGDDYGGDPDAPRRRVETPGTEPATIDGDWRSEPEAAGATRTATDPRRADDVRHHRRSLPPPAESIPLQRAARRAKRTRQGWVVTLTTVIVVIVLAACGAASWFLLHDNANRAAAPRQSDSGAASGPASAEPDRLAARDTDATPLTGAELFGRTELSAGDGRYRVLKTEALADCATAASKTMGPHLSDSDCSQVVRATVADAAGEYAATVGVVNLTDADAATDLRGDIEDGSGGAFNALRAQGPSRDLGLNPTVLGFNTYGHYLLYAVIGRADGKSPSKQDDDVSQIVADLVDVYLVKTLEPRAE